MRASVRAITKIFSLDKITVSRCLVTELYTYIRKFASDANLQFAKFSFPFIENACARARIGTDVCLGCILA